MKNTKDCAWTASSIHSKSELISQKGLEKASVVVAFEPTVIKRVDVTLEHTPSIKIELKMTNEDNLFKYGKVIFEDELRSLE